MTLTKKDRDFVINFINDIEKCKKDLKVKYKSKKKRKKLFKGFRKLKIKLFKKSEYTVKKHNLALLFYTIYGRKYTKENIKFIIKFYSVFYKSDTVKITSCRHILHKVKLINPRENIYILYVTTRNLEIREKILTKSFSKNSILFLDNKNPYDILSKGILKPILTEYTGIK